LLGIGSCLGSFRPGQRIELLPDKIGLGQGLRILDLKNSGFLINGRVNRLGWANDGGRVRSRRNATARVGNGKK
jgi:hypothetical protein